MIPNTHATRLIFVRGETTTDVNRPKVCSSGVRAEKGEDQNKNVFFAGFNFLLSGVEPLGTIFYSTYLRKKAICKHIFVLS